MTKPSVVATPYQEINSVLHELLSGVRAILGRRFVGMYLDGSLAIGDFEPDKSDLDFVVVTEGELSAETFRDLKTMHEHIATGSSKWTKNWKARTFRSALSATTGGPPLIPTSTEGALSPWCTRRAVTGLSTAICYEGETDA